jgi:photosystem II stability/assembly factor-like uncharacterized protein
LEGSEAQCIAADGDRVFVGTFNRGIHRSLDGGSTWTDVSAGIPHPRVLSVTISPHGEVYAGTEPSSLYRSTDHGETWEDLAAMRDVPSYDTWFFPPRPETHHVRWIAPHASDRDTIVVGIELGGVLRTRDGGKTFEDRHPDAVIDPHVVHAHPRATDRIYAIGGDGVSFSLDSGDSWARDTNGMDRFYTWGLAVDPGDPDLWFVSAAPGPDRAHGNGDSQGRMYRKRDGAAWEPLGAAQPDMPYALAAPEPGTLVAGLRSGEIRVSEDAGDNWRTLDAKLPGILAISAV